jgi:hypothetical protein
MHHRDLLPRSYHEGPDICFRIPRLALEAEVEVHDIGTCITYPGDWLLYSDIRHMAFDSPVMDLHLSAKFCRK